MIKINEDEVSISFRNVDEMDNDLIEVFRIILRNRDKQKLLHILSPLISVVYLHEMENTYYELNKEIKDIMTSEEGKVLLENWRKEFKEYEN